MDGLKTESDEKTASHSKFALFIRVFNRANTMYVLAIVVIAGLVWGVLASKLDDYGKGIITLVLGRFLGYLDVIYSFEFGTTKSSKQKDETITTLANKE